MTVSKELFFEIKVGFSIIFSNLRSGNAVFNSLSTN
jgi:hypothetical protein